MAQVRIRYAQPGDWAAHKATIRRLYVEEDRPLKEVSAIMEQDFNLRATPKMFKDRLKKWGLDKHLNSDEVLAMVRTKAARDAAGKPATEFRRRGAAKVINFDAVEQYLRRNPAISERFTTGDNGKSLEALRIVCRTPPPPPPTGLLLRANERLAVGEEYLGAVRDFVGSFICGNFVFDYIQIACVLVDCAWHEARRLVSVASDLLNRGDARGIRIINKILDYVATGMRSLCGVGCVAFIDEVHGQLVGPHAIQLKTIILNQLAKLSARILGHLHPWSRMMSLYLKNLTPSDFADCDFLAVTFVQRHLQGLMERKDLQPNEANSFVLTRTYLSSRIFPSDVDILNRLKEHFFPADKLEDSEVAWRIWWNINSYLAWSYCAVGQNTCAQETLENCFQRLSLSGGNVRLPEGEFECRVDMGHLHMWMGDLNEASHHFRKAWTLAKELGSRVWSHAALIELAAVIMEMGVTDGANQEVMEEKDRSVEMELSLCEPMKFL